MTVFAPATGAGPARPIFGAAVAIVQYLVLAVVCVLPLAIAGAIAGLAPHLALTPIFIAAVGERDRIGPVGAFAAGLLIDVLSLAPLGTCAGSYVLFHAIAARESAALRDMPATGRWLVFMPLAAAVSAIHVAAMMLVGGTTPSRTDIAICVGVTTLAYPVVSALAGVLRRRTPGRFSPIRG